MDDPKKYSLSRRERVRERGSIDLSSKAKALRKQSTDAECLLWHHLRARRLQDYKFRRQVVIPPYIVDFVCLEARLIVEVDGGQHIEQKAYDDQRSTRLENLGYRVIRFWNHEVLGELSSVLEKIVMVLNESPSPQPSPEGRGGK